MAHPRNDCGLRTLLNGYPLRSGDGAAADWCGVFCDGRGQLVRKVVIAFVEFQKVQHGITKRVDVFFLFFFAPIGIGDFAFGVAFRGSLCFQFHFDSRDGFGRCVNTFGERAAALFFFDRP